MSRLFSIEVGERIRAQRERLGLTQAQLANQIGLSRTSVTNIECGRQRLLVDQLAEIASALEVDIHNLIPPSSLKSQNVASENERDLPPAVARWLKRAQRKGSHETSSSKVSED